MPKLRRASWPSELAEAVRRAAEHAGADGDHVLAAVADTTGAWAAGSRSALYLPMPGSSELRRLGWEQVERAEWSADDSRFHIWEAAVFGEPMPRTDLAVEEPGRFGQLMRERISASVLVERHVVLTGRKGVRVVGRRNPSRPDGQVRWSFVLDKGLDPAEPGLLDRAEKVLAEVRDELGV